MRKKNWIVIGLLFMKKNSGFLFRHSGELSRLMYSIIRGKSRTVAVSLRLTDRCQLNCLYCQNRNSGSDINIYDLVSFLKKMRKKGLFYVILSGGEPFLYPHLDILLQFLKEYNFYIVMNTNGQAIKNSRYKKVLSEMDEVVVSIDGPEKENDFNRGNGSYKNIMMTIRFLRRINIKTVLSTVITRNNLNETMLSFFLKLKKKFGLILDFGVVSPFMFGEYKDNLIIEEKKQVDFIEKLLRFKEKYNIRELSDAILSYQKKPYEIKCVSTRYTMYIDVDGSVYPCIYGIGKKNMKLGNIKDYNNINKSIVSCEACFCQSLLALNLLSQKKFSIISFLRWI